MISIASMSRCPSRHTLTGALAVLACVAAADAAAQTSGPAQVTIEGKRIDARRQSDATALFGANDLKDVPFSINIVDAEDMQDRQAKNLAEALAYDPTVTSGFGATGDAIYTNFEVRGFWVSNIVKNGSVFDVYYPVAHTYGLEKIEVLRGPAAFRYGFISPGGLVNMVSKRATETSVTDITFGVDQFGYADAHADVARRLGRDGRWGVRLNAARARGDTWVDGAEQDRHYVGLSVDRRFGEALTIQFSFEEDSARGEGQRTAGYTRVGLDPTTGGLREFDNPESIFFGQDWEFADRKDRTYSLELDWRPWDGFSLSSDTSYFESDEYVQAGYALSTYRPDGDYDVGLSAYGWHPRSLTNTTYGVLEVETGAIGHRLVFGGMLNEADTYGSGVFTGEVIGAANLFREVALPLPGYTLPDPTDFIADQYGVFVSDQLTIAKRWHPFFGLRWSSISSYTREASGLRSPKVENDAITPSVGLVFDLTDEINLYGSYATGLERGGIAPADTTNAGEQMDPQDTKQIELGIKSVLNQRLSVDAALFAITKKAEYRQVNQDGSFTYVQDGEQRHTGAELLLRGQVTDRLELNGGVQYIDAEYRRSPDNAGSKPVNIPELQVVLQADYELPWITGLAVLGGVRHVGEREVLLPNSVTQDAHTLVDAGVRYEVRNMTIRVNANNLLNEFYYSVVGYGGDLGAPRTVRASFEMKF